MNKKETEREAFFDYFKKEQKKQIKVGKVLVYEIPQKKVYATPEAYKTEHQEEQNKHIKKSVEAAVKGLFKTLS